MYIILDKNFKSRHFTYVCLTTNFSVAINVKTICILGPMILANNILTFDVEANS